MVFLSEIVAAPSALPVIPSLGTLRLCVKNNLQTNHKPPASGFFHFYGPLPMTNHDDTQSAIAENEKRIEVHEAVCAERYQGILDRFIRGDRRMQRIEYILYFLMLMALVGRDGALKLVELFIK